MTSDRDNEWIALAGTARRMIDDPAQLPVDEATKHFSPILHLWISPTFTPERHYVFYEPRPNLNPLPNPFVRDIAWNKAADHARFQNGEILDEPTFSSQFAAIEWSELRRILEVLSKLTFPPFAEFDTSGRDGEMFGVQTFGLLQNARLTWWSEVHESWSALVKWHKETVDFCEGKLNER